MILQSEGLLLSETSSPHSLSLPWETYLEADSLARPVITTMIRLMTPERPHGENITKMMKFYDAVPLHRLLSPSSSLAWTLNPTLPASSPQCKPAQFIFLIFTSCTPLHENSEVRTSSYSPNNSEAGWETHTSSIPTLWSSFMRLVEPPCATALRSTAGRMATFKMPRLKPLNYKHSWRIHVRTFLNGTHLTERTCLPFRCNKIMI